MKARTPNYIAPLKSAWLQNPDGTETAVRVETRVGGAYRIELPGGETRIVNRSQLKPRHS